MNEREARRAFLAECQAFQDRVKAQRLKDGCTYQVMAGLYGPILCRKPVRDESTDYCAEHHPVVLAECQRIQQEPWFQNLLKELEGKSEA